MFEVTYDGQNWKAIPEYRVRIIMGEHYTNVPAMMAAMRGGEPVGTLAALYRYAPAHAAKESTDA